MPAQVTKLIAKLRKSYPELQDEPMLDQLEAAAYEDKDKLDFEVDAEAAEVPYEDGEEAPLSTEDALDRDGGADDEFDMEKAADAMNMLEDAEGEDEEMPMPKRKRKGKGPSASESEDINGGY